MLSFYSASALLAMQTVPGQNGDKPKRRKSKRRHSKTATKGMAKTATNQNASARHQRQIPTGPVRISNTTVLPVSQVRDLGVYLDANVTMKAHVTANVRACFSALRQIQSVRRSLPRHALLTLIRALVVSKVDYCNSVLAGAPGHLLDRLQSVLNAAARLIFAARKTEHTTPLL